MNSNQVVSIIAIFCSLLSTAQLVNAQNIHPEQDCKSAIPVCQLSYSRSKPYSGSGNIPNEINSNLTCLGSGEQNSVWFKYSVINDGFFGFTIIPNAPWNDYDWIVFNITQASCDDIYADSSLVVSCSFSPQSGNTGPNGEVQDNSKPLIPAQAGNIYAIVVNRFSVAGSEGFKIDFSVSTAYSNCMVNIDENTVGNTIDVFPNPSDGKFTIGLHKNYIKTFVTIYDSKGRLIEQKQVFNTNNILFDVFYPSGIYYVQLKFDNNVVTKKIIIN